MGKEDIKKKMDEIGTISHMMLTLADVFGSAGGSRADTIGMMEHMMYMMGEMNMNKKQIKLLDRLSALIILSIFKAHDLGGLGIQLESELPDFLR